MEVVLTAAARVFEELGFAKGTTNRIAQRAGVSIGTLYQYYPGKEAIAVELVRRHVAEQVRAAHEWGGRTLAAPAGLRPLLRSFVELAISAHALQPRLHQVLLEELPLPRAVHDAVQEAEADAARTLAGVLRRLEGVRRADLARAALVVVQLTVSMVHRIADLPERERRRGVSELVDVLEAYLSTPGPA
jgi:AcrR family transcriptional regulator